MSRVRRSGMARAAAGAAFFAAVLSIRVSAASDRAEVSGRLLGDSLGARASGLAEAGTAMTGDLGALSFNPAGLPFMKQYESTARFQKSVGDVTSGVLGVGGLLGPVGWGVSAGYLDAGTIDLAFTSGASYSRRAEQDYVVQGGVGFPLFSGVTLGLGAKSFHSTLVQDFTATAVVGDAGLLVKTPLTGLLVGASVRNVGGKLTYISAGDSLPTEERAGISYSYNPEGVRDFNDESAPVWSNSSAAEVPLFTVLLDGIRDRSGAYAGAGGVEWTGLSNAALRIGYGWGENATGLTLGLGIKMNRFSLDYSWRLVDNLADSNRLSLSVYW